MMVYCVSRGVAGRTFQLVSKAFTGVMFVLADRVDPDGVLHHTVIRLGQRGCRVCSGLRYVIYME